MFKKLANEVVNYYEIGPSAESRAPNRKKITPNFIYQI